MSIMRWHFYNYNYWKESAKKKKKLVIGSVPARLEIGEVKSDAQAKNIPVKKIARNGSMYNKTLVRNSIPDAKIKSLHKFIAELIGY